MWSIICGSKFDHFNIFLWMFHIYIPATALRADFYQSLSILAKRVVCSWFSASLCLMSSHILCKLGSISPLFPFPKSQNFFLSISYFQYISILPQPSTSTSNLAFHWKLSGFFLFYFFHFFSLYFFSDHQYVADPIKLLFFANEEFFSFSLLSLSVWLHIEIIYWK